MAGARIPVHGVAVPVSLRGVRLALGWVATALQRAWLTRHALLLLAALAWVSAVCANSDVQYRIDRYSRAEGLAGDSINQIVPLSDGHILVTSFYDPPTLFDGHRFTTLADPGVEAPGRPMSVAFEYAPGVLVLGGAGVRSIRTGPLHGAGRSVELPTPADTVRAFARHGDLLLVGTNAGLHVLVDLTTENAHWRGPAALPGREISAITVSRDGRLLVGTDAGLYVGLIDDLRLVPHEQAHDVYIWTVVEAADGTIHVATRGRGLLSLVGQSIEVLDTRSGFAHDVVRQMQLDGEGGLWVATAGAGLVHLHSDGGRSVLDTSDGLPGDTLYSVVVDEEGSIWTAGPGVGLVRVRATAFQRWGRAEGLLTAFTWTLHEDRERGWLYAGGNSGITRRRGADTQVLGPPGSGSAAVVRALHATRSQLWVGTDAGLYSWVEGAGFEVAEALAQARVTIVEPLADGRLLVAGNGVWLYDGREARSQPLPISGPVMVLAVAEDEAHGLWIATADHGLWLRTAESQDRQLVGSEVGSIRGLLRLRGQLVLAARGLHVLDIQSRQLRPLAAFNEAHPTQVHALIADDHGGLWAPTNIGLFRFELPAFEAFVAANGPEPLPNAYELSDGLSSTEFNGGSQGSALQTTDGMLWLASTNGAIGIRPGRVQRPRIAARAVVLGLSADGDVMTLPDSPRLRLPAGIRQVLIDYTALPASAGGEAQFRYRLLPGFESLVPAAAERRATFTGLRPGAYRFEVEAIRPGAQAIPTLASIEFEIAPAWHQQALTWVLVTLVSLALLLGVPAFHIHGLRIQRRQLLEQVREKTAVLEQLAATDSLTGLPNRRSFRDGFERMQAPFGLLIIDIDHFKRYNDSAGHQAGDEALISVAKVLRMSASGQDLVARLGGEEFALLCPGSVAEALQRRAELLRAQLAQAAIAHPDSPLGPCLTVSIGGASAQAHEALAVLYQRADQALYTAKREGRDRVVIDL